MSTLANTLRPFWAPGLNDISGNIVKGLGGWLTDEEFNIFEPVKAKHFVLSMADAEPFLAALAADINRTAIAAYESVRLATRSTLFPKSTAWPVIKSYYAAFFAAHAILRMLGTGFTTLEIPHAASINRIATLYGVSNENVTPGTFTFTYFGAQREAHWDRFDSSSGGVHERFWAFFRLRIANLSRDVLKTGGGITSDNQAVSGRLTELLDNLCYEACPKGNWLSVVRNRVNCRHQFGAWYPYRPEDSWGAADERMTNHWLADPMGINLTSHAERNLRRFQETCSFIVACCRVLVSDMASRCANGKSFHTYGWLAIDRFARQRESR